LLRYLADATFLTYACLVDVNILRRHQFCSITLCIKEAQDNLKDPILVRQLEELVEIIGTGRRIEQGNKNLSETDKRLLATAVENRNDTLLVTDDLPFAFEARARKVDTLSTPFLITLLAQKKEEGKGSAMKFLNKLMNYYNRERKVLAAISKLDEKEEFE